MHACRSTLEDPTDDDDYFVLKPRHSGFYCTALEILLDHLGISSLILAGFATNLCVLYTAYDAYMREYELHVPADCTAAETRLAHDHALQHLRRDLKADIRSARSLWRVFADKRRSPKPRKSRASRTIAG